MKLMTYDGSGSLETVLAKFSKLAEYMQWSDTDCYYHLCASLNGIAGQVLWDAGPQATAANVIGLLRTRFGNELQAERFKAELKVRRRRRTGESLQQLYQDISKLVALAHPNEGPALVNHVAKESFVIALSDPILQLKVIEREPKTVEDALNIAVKIEAYQASVVPPELDKGAVDHKARHKVKSTYTVEGIEQDTLSEEASQRSQSRALIESQLADLQKQCNSNREALGRLKAQKEEAEKKAAQAAQAAQAAKASAQAAKSANPPAATGSASNPGGGGNGFQRQQGGYRSRDRGRGNHRTGDCPNGAPPEQPAVPLVPAAIRTVSAVEKTATSYSSGSG